MPRLFAHISPVKLQKAATLLQTNQPRYYSERSHFKLHTPARYNSERNHVIIQPPAPLKFRKQPRHYIQTGPVTFQNETTSLYTHQPLHNSDRSHVELHTPAQLQFTNYTHQPSYNSDRSHGIIQKPAPLYFREQLRHYTHTGPVTIQTAGTSI